MLFSWNLMISDNYIMISDISTLNISNTDISKYVFYQKLQFGKNPNFIVFSTPVISNYWYFKENFLDQKTFFEISEVWYELYREFIVVTSTISWNQIQSTLDISNLLLGYAALLFLFTFQLLLSQTTDISKKIFLDQKIFFEISEVWIEFQLWDIECSL